MHKSESEDGGRLARTYSYKVLLIKPKYICFLERYQSVSKFKILQLKNK